MHKTAQTEAPLPKGPLPPYVPYKTFVNVIDNLRNVVMPYIDKAVIGSLSGGMHRLKVPQIVKLINAERATGAPAEAGGFAGRSESASAGCSTPRMRRCSTARSIFRAPRRSTKAAFADIGAQGETMTNRWRSLWRSPRTLASPLPSQTRRSTAAASMATPACDKR